ncbi:MAG TPA: hypothetical protein VGM37_21825 [Armatimonadota bacterium]|jgi:hypothetical protein
MEARAGEFAVTALFIFVAFSAKDVAFEILSHGAVLAAAVRAVGWDWAFNLLLGLSLGILGLRWRRRA